MRIVIFTCTYWPTVNGVAVSIANQCEGLEALGHEVLIVAPEEPGFDHSQETGVIRLPSFRPPQKPDYPIALPILNRAAKRQLRAFDPHVINVMHPWMVGARGIRWARQYDKTCLLTVHTQYGLYAGYSPLPEVTKDIMEKLLIKACERVDLVTTPGEGSRQRLIGLGIKTPVICVSNPTKLADFTRANGPEVRQRYGITPYELLLGYVGRLNEEKHLEALLEAFEIISRERSNARLMIVGDGSDKVHLQAMAEQIVPGRVVFTGAVNHADIAPYFAALDLFVTPSESEVQPMSFAEAFGAEVPIVAYDVTGCNDMVKPEVSGALVPLNNGPAGLAAASLMLLADPARLRLLGQSTRDWAQQYEQMRAVDAMVEAYSLAIDLH